MSEIVASNITADTNETEQVIEDLQNVGNVDVAAAKLSALKGKETGDSSAAEGETINGVSDQDNKPETQHNGSNQNGDAITEQTTGTSTGTEEGSEKSESKPEEPSSNEPTSESSASGATSGNQAAEQSSQECNASCDASGCIVHPNSAKSTASESEVQSNTECSEYPTNDAASGEGQTEGDQVAINKQMEELSVESQSAKGSSPAKKSCSPF